MRSVQADQVKTRLLAAAEGIAKPAAEVFDVLLVHGPGLHRVGGEGQDRAASDGKRHFAGVKVGAVDAAVGKLDTRQSAVGFHRLGHTGQGGEVAVIPEALFDEGSDLGCGVNLGLFGEDHAPAALGLGAAHLDHGGGIAVAAAVAMRDLVKAVLGQLWPDLHRREKDVVAGVAGLGFGGHSNALRSSAWVERRAGSRGGISVTRRVGVSPACARISPCGPVMSEPPR